MLCIARLYMSAFVCTMLVMLIGKEWISPVLGLAGLTGHFVVVRKPHDFLLVQRANLIPWRL